MMKAVLKNGDIVDIDTKYIFDNQYNTTEEHGARRIHDTDIIKIIDDIRLTDFYCAEGIERQGNFDEVQKAINEKRAKIDKCLNCDGKKNCFWWQIDKIENISKTTENGENGVIIETKKYKYIYHCGYKAKPEYSKDGKCAHDINPAPLLFREKHKKDCFFCKYPQGLPIEANKKFIDYIVNNHEKYGIVSYWEHETIAEAHSIKHKQNFGSYLLKIHHKDENPHFVLRNSRNTFDFIYDFESGKFIVRDYLTYKAVATFTEDKYDYNRQKTVKKTITGFDKFIKYFSQILADYRNI